MIIQCIIHAPFELPGTIAEWAEACGHDIRYIHTYCDEALPIVDNTDFLIIMGGPQSPLALEEAPYLADEINFVREFLVTQKPILGICLGAQIIAESLGARTEKSPQKEIGMYPIELTAAANSDPYLQGFPQSLPVMHWHNDMPGLPKGSEVLATSAGCPRQIVRFARHIYVFQCHLEMTPTCIQGMLDNCADDLKPNTYVQDAETLLSADTKEMNHYMQQFLTKLSLTAEKNVQLR